MPKPPRRSLLDRLFGLTPAEEAEARAAAGRPWRTAYYVASHDWPVQEPGGVTLEDARKVITLLADEGEAPNNA